MAFPEDKRNTNGFDKNPQNINKKGAPRKTINSVNQELEDRGITEATKEDIKSCYLRLINFQITELEEMSEDEKQPALIRIVAVAILSGKGFEIIEKILDRSIGKAEQKTDLTSAGKAMEINVKAEQELKLNLDDLTLEALRAIKNTQQKK